MASGGTGPIPIEGLFELVRDARTVVWSGGEYALVRFSCSRVALTDPVVRSGRHGVSSF
jgi:hypothetical protein